MRVFVMGARSSTSHMHSACATHANQARLSHLHCDYADLTVCDGGLDARTL